MAELETAVQLYADVQQSLDVNKSCKLFVTNWIYKWVLWITYLLSISISVVFSHWHTYSALAVVHWCLKNSVASDWPARDATIFGWIFVQSHSHCNNPKVSSVHNVLHVLSVLIAVWFTLPSAARRNWVLSRRMWWKNQFLLPWVFW